MILLPLQKGILYGPIDSRRLGKSLGVNLMPVGYKLCPFNCVYCHYGVTNVHECDVTPYIQDLPVLDDIINEIKRAFVSDTDFDYVTFSGNGEPTLYPWFKELVDAVVEMRNRHRSKVRIALLSNSVGLLMHDVRAVISKIDLPVFKLDAGTEEDFIAINRPARNVMFNRIVDELGSLKNIYIQSVIIDGKPSNTGEEQLSTYYTLIKKIMPKEVHIYSIDRPVPNSRIIRVSPERLKTIAKAGSEETGVRFKAFYMK